VLNRLSQLAPCLATCSGDFSRSALSAKSIATGCGAANYSVLDLKYAAGLGFAAPLPRRTRRDRRHRLGRKDQDL